MQKSQIIVQFGSPLNNCENSSMTYLSQSRILNYWVEDLYKHEITLLRTSKNFCTLNSSDDFTQRKRQDIGIFTNDNS